MDVVCSSSIALSSLHSLVSCRLRRKTLTVQIHESRVEERFSSSTCVLQMKRHSRPPASTLISVTSHYAVPAVTVRESCIMVEEPS
ncbi:hypothetical protein I312_106604 [Cryptococcus bacillisporus CA1280]|uniref:uncharacterized protein n=1 Tax=Cryptococcus bacillisporus CA1280 TaxID=1296109 RepID=UPI0033671B50